MDCRAAAEAAYRCELAVLAATLAGDAATVRAATAPGLIHIDVDAQVTGAEQLLAQSGDGGNGGGAAEHGGALTAGPVEALAVGPHAVIITYPLAEAAGAPAAIRHEVVAILWLHRQGAWQAAWIHATPLADPTLPFADPAACGQLVNVVCPAGAHSGSTGLPVEESTLAERRWEVINCERAVVQQVVDHDVAGAAAATWEGLISIETDGRRLGLAEWLAFVGDWKRSLEPPRYGPMQVLTVSPTAMLVTYTLEVQGSYDGQPFAFGEALSSLWVWLEGRWQAVFMQATVRPPVAPHPPA